MKARLSIVLTLIALVAAVIPTHAQDRRNPPSIAAENADQLREVARFGTGRFNSYAASPDLSQIAAATTLGVYIFPRQAVSTPRLLETRFQVLEVAFSPDGQWLYGVARDGIWRWELATGEPTHLYRLRSIAGAVDLPSPRIILSPDGTLLAFWDISAIYIIDTATGKFRWALPREQFASFQNFGTFSADGARYVSFAGMWSITGEQARPLAEFDPLAMWWSFAANDERLVAVFRQNGKNIGRVYNVEDGTQLNEWSLPNGISERHFALLHGGKSLVVFSADDLQARLYSVETGEQIAGFQGEQWSDTARPSSPDGKIPVSGLITLAALNDQQSVLINIGNLLQRWEIPQTTLEASLLWNYQSPTDNSDSYTSFHLNRDQSEVLLSRVRSGTIYGMRELAIHDVQTGKKVNGSATMTPNPLVGQLVSANDVTVVVPSFSTYQTTFINLAQRQIVSDFILPQTRTGLASSDNHPESERPLLNLQGDLLAYRSRVYNAQGELFQELPSPTGLEFFIYSNNLRYAVSWQRNGRYFDATQGEIAIEGSHNIDLYRVEDGTRIATLSGHTSRIVYAAFSPDERLLVSADMIGRVCLWRTEDGTHLGCIWLNAAINFGNVLDLTFRSDGKQVALISESGVILLAVDTVQSSPPLSISSVMSPASVSFSHDGQLLLVYGALYIGGSASDEYGILLIDTQQMSPVGLAAPLGMPASPTLRADNPNAVAISPTSALFAVRQYNTIEVRELPSSRLLKVLDGHTDVVNEVIFSPDGRYLISSSYDGTTRLWAVE